MFEPLSHMDSELPDSMLANSVHNKADEEIYCNIINAGDEAITIKQGKELGQLLEVEAAQKEFETNVLKYVPLNLDNINSKAKRRFKLNETKFSKMLKPNGANLDEYLTCEDLIDHEIKMKVRKLKFNSNLSHFQKAQLLEVILKNRSAFQWNDKQLAQTKLAVHEIPGTQPQVSSQYHIPSVDR